MNNILNAMLKKYTVDNSIDFQQALREIIQEIVLYGFSKTDFFKHAAFYGGTALRIFYGLQRYSEDLDFSLVKQNDNFDLSNYLSKVEDVANSFGLRVTIEQKEKTKDTTIKSAFLKANTRELNLVFISDYKLNNQIPRNAVTRIKLEIDIDPPEGASFEYRVQELPALYSIRLYDAPSLFAGKLHAVICRAWQQRVKGRDLYDYLFYIAGKHKINVSHLSARLQQSGVLTKGVEINAASLKELLLNKFKTIDFNLAKEDVIQFIRDKEIVYTWSFPYFKSITDSWQPVFV